MGLRGPRVESNKAISSVRSRIEHSFGFIEESLGGSVVRGRSGRSEQSSTSRGHRWCTTFVGLVRLFEEREGKPRKAEKSNRLKCVLERNGENRTRKLEKAQKAESRRNLGYICYRFNKKLIVNRINYPL